MNWHPLTLALLLSEALSVVIYVAAAGRLFGLLPVWQTGTDDGDQLARERALETVWYQASWAAALQALALVLLVLGISNVWPAFVPGAMCGMGVLQALGTAGSQALFFKALTLMAFYCWYAAHHIEGRLPEATGVAFHGRLLLLVFPFMVLGTWSLVQALAGLDAPQPVSCCAAVYDAALGNDTDGPYMAMDTMVWVVTGFAIAGVVVGWGWRQWSRPHLVAIDLKNWPVAVIWAGLPVAYFVLTRVAAPYILQLLYHPCPWCLLLIDHGAPGLIYFGLLVWIAAESLVMVVAGQMVRHNASFMPHALQRTGVAGLRIAMSTLVWVVAAGLPGLWWFLRFGDWMR